LPTFLILLNYQIQKGVKMKITKEIEDYMNNQIAKLYNNEFNDCWEYFDAIGDKFGLDAETDEINKMTATAKKALGMAA
jgi:ribosome-associated translation inhibitor RaiA